jgi:hypothetical protein
MKKTILTRLFVSFVLALGASALSAQTHWSYTPGTYQEDMRFFFELRQDGVVLDLDNYEIAAFIGDECRGIATKESQVVSESTIYYGRIQVEAASTETGATITFKAYEKTTETEFDIKTDVAYTFTANTTVGTLSELKQFELKPAVMKGDVNGDDQITAQDASLVLQLVAKKIAPTADGIVYGAADVNEDGDVTAQDASLILQYVAKKITW